MVLIGNKFVRKTGSDAAAGTSAGTAWLTLGKALGASGMADGDTLYVGAGTYREAITIGFTPTVTTSIIGDVTGAFTGDPGEVRWTAFTTNDTTAPGAQPLILNGKTNLTFQHIVFVGGLGTSGNGCCVNATTTNSTNITFQDCAFLPGSATGSTNSLPIAYVGLADTASTWLIERCVLWNGSAAGHVKITLPTSSIADYASNFTVRNCLFLDDTNQFGGVFVTSSGAGSFKGGAVNMYDCTLFHSALVTGSANVSVSIPCLAYNNWIHTLASNGVSASANGQVVEDYNLLRSNRQNTSIGPFSIATGNYADLLSLGHDTVFGGTIRPFGSPLSGSPILGFGNAILTAGRTATVINDATVGTIGWTNPGNASVPDGTNATCVLLLGTTGQYLNAQGFTGFGGIPSDATINSIRVETIVLASVSASVKCSSVKLLKAGVITGNDLASSNTTLFTTSAVIHSWGSTADPLWGTTWTVAQVQAAGFGCVWAPVDASNAATCSVDFIRVIVAYSTADGHGGVATDMLGATRPASEAVGALEYSAGSGGINRGRLQGGM